MKQQFEIHYKSASTDDCWHLSNLGRFKQPSEAYEAASAWKEGYEKTHGVTVEVRAMSAGWFDRQVELVPKLLAALTELVAAIDALATSPVSGPAVTAARIAIAAATGPQTEAEP